MVNKNKTERISEGTENHSKEVPNFNPAIGISSSIKDIDQCLHTLEESFLYDIEIPGVWLDTPGILDKIEESKLNIVGVTNLIESSVSASIADYNKTIQQGFIEKLILLMNRLEGLYIDRFSIETGFETIFKDPNKVAKRVTLLKNIAPYLYRKNIEMVIPVRIPGISEIPRGKYASFLRGSMCSNIKLALNIHPHETLKIGDPYKLLEEFRFFIKTVSFVYEPETGNTLVKKLIDPWFEALAKLDYEGDIIFHPRVSNLGSLIKSVENFTNFL
jgi:hypothetical protein